MKFRKDKASHVYTPKALLTSGMRRLFPKDPKLPLKLGDKVNLDIPVPLVDPEASVKWFNDSVLQHVEPHLTLDDQGVLDVGRWVRNIRGVSEEDIKRPSDAEVFSYTFSDVFWEKAARHYAVGVDMLRTSFDIVQGLDVEIQTFEGFEVLQANNKPCHAAVYQTSETHTVFIERVFNSEVFSGEVSMERLLEKVSYQILHGYDIRQMQNTLMLKYKNG
jgi:ribosomal protein L19